MAVTTLHPGERFAQRYEVVRCIELGGMGAIYEVLHLETRRRRALKLMLPSVVENEDLRKRFRLEATVAAEVESEHIAETFDAGIDETTGAPFLVMELLRGVELATLLEEVDRLAPGDALLVLRQAALGLDKTHAAGIIHRDLKPANLFLTERDDGSLRLKLLDFGIAKVVAQVTNPATTKVMGTPLYMAPEQLTGDGKVGAAADRYALGMMAFTLLTGWAYWKKEADASESIFNFLLDVVKGHPEPATDRAARHDVELPEGFDAWFEKATAQKPADRFESAAEQVEALAETLGCEIPAEPSDALREAFDREVAKAEDERKASEPPLEGTPVGLDREPTGASEAPSVGGSHTQQAVSADTGAAKDRPGSRYGLVAGIGLVAALAVAGLVVLDDEQQPAGPASTVSSPSSAAERDDAPREPPEPRLADEGQREGREQPANTTGGEAESEPKDPPEDEHEDDTEAAGSRPPAPPAPPPQPVRRPRPPAPPPPPPPAPEPEPVDPLKIR